MSSPEANAARTALLPYVDLHNHGYKQRMWLEVADVGDGVEVRLTIGGRGAYRFVRTIPWVDLETRAPQAWALDQGQQWIDEARASSSRTQQRRRDGSLPPPKPKPPQPLTLWEQLEPNATDDERLDAIGRSFIAARRSYTKELRQLSQEYAKLVKLDAKQCAALLLDYGEWTDGRGRASYARWHDQQAPRTRRGPVLSLDDFRSKLPV